MKSKLSDICLIEKGKQIDTNLLDDSNPYKYINGGIKESGFYTDFNTDEPVVTVSEGGASCGYVGYVEEKFWCGCHCYKLSKCKVEPKYLYYALKSNQQKIMNLRTGATMPNIKKELFKQLEINVDLDRGNQLRVINELDNIQNLINANAKKLESFDELIKSRFNEMFGDPLLNENGFLTEKLSVICPFNTYKGDVEAIDGKVWLLNLDMIESNTGVILDKQYVDISEIGNSVIKFDSNCVLYSKLRPYLNKVALPNCSGYASSELIYMKTGKRIKKEFLANLLRNKSFVDYINSKSGGAKMPRANMDFLRNFALMIPPEDLQEKFAFFVSQIDKSKFVVQQQIKDLEELLDKKMDEYFGG